MNPVETTGRTVKEAIDKAISTLGIKEENAAVEVIAEPAQGLFSFISSRVARVKVRPLLGPGEYLKELLSSIIEQIGLDTKITIEEDEEKLYVSISGNKVGVLIGRRGKTLNDLQYLANTIMHRQYEQLDKMVIIDVENYRARREKTLTQLAKGIARRVEHEGVEQVLEPMTPQERRIIHLALQGYAGVETYSRGEDPYRQVVIAPR
ncbi:MAG: protein jag [Firmicutes bacterium]|nr:protein jag [Bacillota bacterium]